MQDEIISKNFDSRSDEVDIEAILRILLDGKWLIASATTFLSIISLIYSLQLPNIYESRALLTPVEPSSSLSGALQSYSSLAALAGVSLPSQNSESNSVQAIEKLNSLSFFENNVLPKISLTELMAVKSWNFNENIIELDPKIYDSKKKKWIRDFSYPKKRIPSAQESFKTFSEKHFTVIEDKKTGFITLSIKHQSPHVAKKWVEIIVDEINGFYRKKDKTEAEKAVNYLNMQINKTNLAEIKQVMAELLQQETQKLTLIEANDFYVFDYIDTPALMEEKSEPKRSLILLLGTIIGIFIGIILVLIRHYRSKSGVS